MKTMTEDELRRHALATGAELVLDGKPFNTARAQMSTKPVRSAAPAAPPAEAEPTFTRTEVATMLAEQEARIMGLMASTVASFQGEKPEVDDSDMVAVGFTPEYLPTGQIKFIGVKWERMQ